MLSMEVSQLIEQCRQGSADALGELYNAYAQRMKSKEDLGDNSSCKCRKCNICSQNLRILKIIIIFAADYRHQLWR